MKAGEPKLTAHFDRERKDWICDQCDRVTDLCLCYLRACRFVEYDTCAAAEIALGGPLLKWKHWPPGGLFTQERWDGYRNDRHVARVFKK